MDPRTRAALTTKWHELDPWLRRKFWRPLRSAMEIFHVLPLAAAVILFVLLATDDQFREIYISYLEGPGDYPAQWVIGLAAAAVALALTSAVLCEAHFSLSTMRANVIYSSYSNPEANSRLRGLQRTAAFCLAMFPWLGVTIGLFGARNFVADRYCKLLEEMPDSDRLHGMQHLLVPGGWPIAAAIVVLGAAIAAFACVDQKTRIAQRAVALLAPSIGALLFLLFTDWLIFSIKDRWWLVFFAATVLATVLYFMVYQWLQRRQQGPIFLRAHGGARGTADDELEITPVASRRRLVVAWMLSFFVAQPEYSVGTGMRRRRRQMLIVWAFVPWLLFALYFAVVPYSDTTQTADHWSQSGGHSLCPIAATQIPVPGHWTIFPVVMCCTIAMGLLVGLLLNRLSEEWKWRRIMTMGAVVVFAVAALAASMLLDADSLVTLYRAIGPLGTTVFQVLFLISTFALLAWLSQRSGFPVLTFVVLTVVVCVMFPNYAGSTTIAFGLLCIAVAIIAFLSRLYAVGAFVLILPVLGIIQWHQLQGGKVGPNTEIGIVRNVDRNGVKVQFECWLRQRGIPAQDGDADMLAQVCPVGVRGGENQGAANQGAAHQGAANQAAANRPATRAGARPYPVFIIAAEGGGIYAASAASMFLAKLQRDAPHFAEHVFALSGVSGGAIGTTIFQALDKVDTSTAASPQASTRLMRNVTKIMEDDHFSPVVGAIFPEMLGAPAGRAQTLVASFKHSTSEQDAMAGKALKQRFSRHWSYRSLAPALVLNATWVETGFRVAFAPFHLHALDESLYSFSDVSMPDEKCPKVANERGCVTLMEAAAVSARFPLVLPPFSTQMGLQRWNFVDGGYADNSGATTALDLYRTLKKVAPDKINLQIVLVTSSTPQLNFGKINGTVFRDTIAPIDAMMKVRADLGNDAVARACSEMFDQEQNATPGQPRTSRPKPSRAHPEANAFCVDQAAEPSARLHIVEIQDQTYGLALGWKISQTSFDVVSWMLGEAADCTEKPPSLAAASRTPAPAAAASDMSPPADLSEADPTPGGAENAKLNRPIVLRNSCVMKLIDDLVATGSQAGGR